MKLFKKVWIHFAIFSILLLLYNLLLNPRGSIFGPAGINLLSNSGVAYYLFNHFLVIVISNAFILAISFIISLLYKSAGLSKILSFIYKIFIVLVIMAYLGVILETGELS